MLEAQEMDVQVSGHVIKAEKEELRGERVVRVGLIQNKIVLPTDRPLIEQVG